MARITIDCADPNDFTAITEAAEKAAGRCNITYAKQAAALVDAGTVKSERAAAKQIAEETGEPVNTVRAMIQRGKAEVDAVASKNSAGGRLSELERAEKVIVKAARLLERIVAGSLRDNGTDNDRLTAESIRRHGPGIVISFIQLGIDVHKVYDFYRGTASNTAREL